MNIEDNHKLKPQLKNFHPSNIKRNFSLIQFWFLLLSHNSEKKKKMSLSLHSPPPSYLSSSASFLPKSGLIFANGSSSTQLFKSSRSFPVIRASSGFSSSVDTGIYLFFSLRSFGSMLNIMVISFAFN